MITKMIYAQLVSSVYEVYRNIHFRDGFLNKFVISLQHDCWMTSIVFFVKRYYK